MANSVGEISSIRCTYKWIIDNFCIRCKDVGEVMKSPVFTTTDAGEVHEWRLSLYPKGNKDENKDYFSIFVYNLSDATLKANIWLEILDVEGIEAVQEAMSEHVFGDNVNNYGFPRFVKREFVEDKENNILRGDKLTIVCKITIITPNNEAIAFKQTAPSLKRRIIPSLLMLKRKNIENQQLVTDFEQLVDDKEFSDVELTVEDDNKTLWAHKSILGKRSRVFAAMFRNDMSEKRENKVKIVDVRHEVLLEMLRYMYTGKVNGIKTIAGELLIAADKYSLDGLRLMCGEVLADDVDVDNAFERIKLAVQHRVNTLKAKVIEFMVEHASEMVNKSEFQQLPCNIICEVCSALAAEKKK